MNTGDKRRQILSAASECLAHFGYDKTTMEDIARRIGLNKTSLYHYYPNKESIFLDVIVGEAQTFLNALQAKAVEARGCRNQILTYLTERFRYYRHVVNLHNLSTETLHRIQPSFKALYRDVQEREIAFIAHLLQEGMASGEIENNDTRRLARIIFTVTDAIKQQSCGAAASGRPDAIDYTAAEKDVVHAVSLMLGGLAMPPQGAH